MRAWRNGAVVALCLLGLAWPARSAAIGIDPILLELSGETPTTLLVLRNDGSEPVRLQLRAFNWAQNLKGEMQLSPTTELVLFPPLLEIAPGEKRNIRVGTTAQPGPAERSFRVLVDELPPMRKSSAGPGLGVATLSQFSLPAFLAAAKPVEEVRVEGLRLANGILSFRLRNAGTVHARPSKVLVEALGSRGESVFAHDWSGWYLLAGDEREYELQVPTSACAQARSFAVHATLDPTVVNAAIESGGRDCAR